MPLVGILFHPGNEREQVIDIDAVDDVVRGLCRVIFGDCDGLHYRILSEQG